MKNKILNIVFWALLIIQGCCMGESTLSHYGHTTVNQNIIMLNPNDTIYKISYPNSTLVLTPNSNQNIIYLSEASENTKIFIQSNLGQDTIEVYCKQYIVYSPSGTCDDEYLEKNVSNPTVIYHTFDSCYFTSTTKDYFNKVRTDNLYIK